MPNDVKSVSLSQSHQSLPASIHYNENHMLLTP